MSVTPVQQIVVGDHNIFSATGDVHVNYQLPASEGEDRRNLLTLLNRVKTFWIDDRLEGPLHGVALLPLDKKTLPGAVEHPQKAVLEESDLAGREIPADKSIGRIFEEASRLLLILGEAGSGKTTTMLELARGLIKSAEVDPTSAVPVVFHLSSWASRRRPLFDWLVEELRTKYIIPARLGRSFLKDIRILPLLDGLDEVAAAHRPACVDAINRFAEEVGVPGLVVCSRFDDYVALPRRLKVSGAVYLKPLEPERVDDYMAAEGQRLASLRAMLLEDEVLKTLATSPLMLDVMSSAYQDLPIETLRDDSLKTDESRREHVFTTYVARMFQRRVGEGRPHTREQMTLWMSWLARNMNRNSQNIFLIERLQPTWLSGRRELSTYLLGSRVAVGVLLALAFGLSNLMDDGNTFAEMTGAFVCYILAGLSMGVFAYLLKSRQVAACGGRADVQADPTRLHLAGSVVTHTVVASIVGGLIAAFMACVWLLRSVGSDTLGGQRSDMTTFWVNLMSNGSPLAAKCVIFLVLITIGGALVGWFYGLLFGLVVGIRDARRSLAEDIQTAETISWSWARARKAAKRAALWGLPTGLPCAVVSFLAFIVYNFYELSIYGNQSGRPALDVFIIIMALSVLGSALVAVLCALVFSFNFAVVAALIGGLNTSRIVEAKDLVSQGMRRSLKNSARAALIAGVILALLNLTGTFSDYAINKWNYGPELVEPLSVPETLLTALTWSVSSALMAGLWYGGADIVKHYTLRAILYRTGCAPRRFDTFLEQAVGLGFMRKVGGGYIFMHSLLREHFAGTHGEALKTDGS